MSAPCNDGTLLDFVDGELDDAAADAFRAHLRDCSDCQDQLCGLVQLRARLQSMKPRSPRADRPQKAGGFTVAAYIAVRMMLVELGYLFEYEWAQSVKAPATAEDFAREYTWVVLNSGMRNTVAQRIFDRVWPLLQAGKPIGTAFNHVGKRGAIELVYQGRDHYFARFRAAGDIVEFCHGLPWIGHITKYHLAKNLGADVAKPDRWLIRLATASGETVDELCRRIARATGDRVASVDVVLWRACALGVIITDGSAWSLAPKPSSEGT